MMPYPICMKCSRMIPSNVGIICKAFPDGIPDDIIDGDSVHDKPYDGDHGMQFKAFVEGMEYVEPKENETAMKIVVVPLCDGISGRSKDGKTMYVDLFVPEDWYERLMLHETVEMHHMEKGMSYTEAHHLATNAEREYCKKHDIDFDDYNLKYHEMLRKIENRHPKPHDPEDMFYGDDGEKEEYVAAQKEDEAYVPCHVPAGSPEGGQFTGCEGGELPASFLSIPKDISGRYHNEIKTGYSSLLKEVPYLKKAVKGIEVVPSNKIVDGKELFGKNSIGSSYNGTIYLNHDMLKDPEKLEKTLKSDVTIGNHPPGCDTLESVIHHEAGHMIDDYLKKATTYALTEPVAFDVKKGWGLGTVSGTLAAWKETNTRLKPPSDYAKTPREAFAEGFSSMLNTPQEEQVEYTKKMKMLFDFLKDSEWKEMDSRTKTTTPRDPHIRELKTRVGIGR